MTYYIVTGTLNPDATGDYYWAEPDAFGSPKFLRTDGLYKIQRVNQPIDDFYYMSRISDGKSWKGGLSVVGDYTANVGTTGTATVTEIVTGNINNNSQYDIWDW